MEYVNGNKILTVGTFVEVGEPREDDAHTHSFDGTIVKVHLEDQMYTVQDGEADCYDVDFDNVTEI